MGFGVTTACWCPFWPLYIYVPLVFFFYPLMVKLVRGVHIAFFRVYILGLFDDNHDSYHGCKDTS
ncbi:hypothetical protein GE21DRAFT_1118932 [Neurospora crassa]|nr:hypothetical protein GE21DRAFT_1118932 [Neurospora crassa]